MSQTQRPNQFDPHRGAEPPDPSERLAQLKNDLTQHQNRLADLGKQQTALQTDIADLETTVAEVKATLTTYGGQVQTLETTLHGLQYFYDQKHKMTVAAIGDKKGQIDDLIREFDYETERMQDYLAELNEKSTAAQQESQKAADNQAAKQADYNAVKAYTQNTNNQLTDLDTLRTSITQADSATDIASMYFLVLEFQDGIGNVNILSQHQLAVDLRQKLGELELAKEYARGKSAEASRLQTEYTAQQTKLATRVAGRRQQLLTQVQTMCPVPPQTTAATSATGTPAAAASTTPASTAAPKK